MQVTWNKCTGDTWCPFLSLNLAHSYLLGREGVYVIWHGGQYPATVYVGQGIIADRLQQHRSNQQILAHSANGLFVTWAVLDQASRDGVERFLAQGLSPIVGAQYPQATPITVNFPW